jgi:YYY domain-containing protein
MTNKNSTPLDLNKVDEQTLVQRLKITPRLARRIITFRPYQSVDELNKVWGIDPETLQRILASVTVQLETPPTPPYPENILPPAAPELRAIIVPEQETTLPLIKEKEEEPLSLSTSETPEVSVASTKTNPSWKVNLLVVLILLIGAYFRFVGLNWDQNFHQHPDERFITMAADGIRGVSGISAYFDTATSSLNPLQFGSYTYGMLPLFITRMVAEWVQMANYDRLTLVGRGMSGVFDLAGVWMLYLLGKRLYNKRTGLLAAALGAAAVLPIQLSHYFAVDSFSTVFVIASVYFAVCAIPLNDAIKITRKNLYYFALFGLVVGLAGACKINTLPVLGVIFLAGLARLIMCRKEPDFRGRFLLIAAGCVLAVLCAFIAFRIFQPYAFAGPGFFGVALNQRWLDVIKEVTNQVAGQSDWPPNTHWTDRPVLYAWSNMVVWGMGIPLGLAGWLGWAWAGWRMWKGEWRAHLLPFLWVGGYFIWQNVQFWRYMRYFLPVYPFIILFAAWALWEVYDRTQESRAKLSTNGFNFKLQLSAFRSIWRGAAALLALVIVLGGTYSYAIAFTQIYFRPITRVAASRWILQNIAGPINLNIESPQGNQTYPIGIGNNQVIIPGDSASTSIHVTQTGLASAFTTIDVRQVGILMYIRIARDEKGTDRVTEGRLSLTDDVQDGQQTINFGDINLNQGQTYYFYYKINNSSQLSISNIVLRDENENDPAIPFDWQMLNQAPGTEEGTIAFTPTSPLRLNRLEIGQFHQIFVPSDTTLKISLFNDGDNKNSLGQSSQVLDFNQPGLHLKPSFDFPPVQLTRGKTYSVAYEITSGSPLTAQGEPYALETSWDDALPLSVDQYDALGRIYTPLNLELYEPDTPQKRDSMIQILSNSDYIVIPSNRAYDAMPRLPLRYPMTLKYYQALFDCNCDGNGIENRAYGLEPPFKSPLGFDLVATFESSPNLGWLSFNDQSADESFTVYDHPKVLIFKKSKDFSVDKVSALLKSVNLDDVIFQTPLAYTQAPTAMQLPADRLAAQTDGGTWSAMFNRLASVNVNEVFGGIAWYLTILLLGWLVFPIVFAAFSGLPDRGYPLIRMAGLLLIAWLAWILGSVKILPFTQLTIGLCIGLALILSAGLAYRQRKKLWAYIKSNWKYILAVEVIFLVVFLIDLRIRLGNPDLWHPWLGGEKPMDFSYFNAVLKSVYFPPENPWYSGHYINYYYYGYVVAAIPTKLLGIIPSIAYNLILPTWFAMTGIGIFSVSFNLVAALRKHQEDILNGDEAGKTLSRPAKLKASMIKHGQPYLAGIIALMAVLLLGNLYMVREFWNYLPELSVSGGNITSPSERVGAVIGGAVQVLTGQAKLPGDAGRWYFDASRPILHDGPDTPIAEFPYFTFLYGDLHAHLLTMPFYGLALGWLVSLLLVPLPKMKWPTRILTLLFGSLCIGIFAASHTWDFPTFLGLGAVMILWGVWGTRTGSIRHFIQVALGYEVLFIGVATLLYAPFTEWFHTEYVSMEFWKGARTPLVDYIFVFGFALFVIASLLLKEVFVPLKNALRRWFSPPNRGDLSWRRLRIYILFLLLATVLIWLWIWDYQVLVLGLPLLAGMLYLAFLKRGSSTLRRITWILFAIGLSLTLLVEVVVLKGDVGRSNMVFRFYDQAWFFFGIGMSLALVELISALPGWPRRLRTGWIIVLGLIVLGAASYPLVATPMKMADRWPGIQNPPHTLDGAQYMAGDTSDVNELVPAIYNDDNKLIDLTKDAAGIQYMQNNIFGSPVIVEGHTTEYRWGSRYSIYTGLPSVIGWSWHMRQQNSLLDGAIIDKRIDDVNNFYNTQDIQAALEFLNRYQVQYIVVSDLERTYYAPEGINKFQEMVTQGKLQIVFGDNTPQTATIFKVAAEK